MDEAQIEKLVTEMTQRISDVSAPRRMSIAEARHYYQSLVSWLETSLAGLDCGEQSAESDMAEIDDGNEGSE